MPLKETMPLIPRLFVGIIWKNPQRKRIAAENCSCRSIMGVPAQDLHDDRSTEQIKCDESCDTFDSAARRNIFPHLSPC